MATPRPGSKEWNADLLKFAVSCQASKDSRLKRLADAAVFMLGTPDYGPDESSYDEGYSQGVADTTYRLSLEQPEPLLPLLNLTPIPLDDYAIEGLTDQERERFLAAINGDDDPEGLIEVEDDDEAVDTSEITVT